MPESRTPFTVSKADFLAKFRPPTPEEAAELGLTPQDKTKKSKTEHRSDFADLSQEQLDLLYEVFGPNSLEEVKMPTPEELTPEYFDKNYPATQQESDKQKGLISFRPSWWNQPADVSEVGPNPETWGEAYIRSLKVEAVKLSGKRFLVETILKPNYIDGTRYYGTKEGTDPSKDPLLSMFQEALSNPQTNRFNRTEDDILKIAAKIKQTILAKAQAKHFTLPDFDIAPIPAILFNRLAQAHPELSQTNTSEWSSTPLLTQENQDINHRLLVGDSGAGGASCLNSVHRNARWDGRGVRFAVIL